MLPGAEKKIRRRTEVDGRRARHDEPMTTTPEHRPVVSTLRTVITWGRREVGAVVLAVVVAGFLLVTPPLQRATYVPSAGGTLITPPGTWMLSVVLLVAGVSVSAGVLVARRHVLLATVLTLLPFVVVPWWQAFAWGWLLGTIAVAVLAAAISWRRAVVPYAASLLIVAVYCGTELPAVLPIGFVTAGQTQGTRLVALALYVVAITAVVATSASIAAQVRARQDQLAAREQERHALRVELVAGERAQVARDLHDVVAHHVSLIAVRAESAPYQHPGLDDAAKVVLAEIADDARQALGELRQVLVVLQRAEAGSTGSAGRAPQPEAADVDELVQSARDAGQQVAVAGEWGPVPSAQGYVLYRAVQEGLTNARRHAPRSAVELTLTRLGSTIGLTMTNPARGTRAVEPGRGIVGMRERVESLGGTMTARVVAEHFELTVTLPVDITTEQRAEASA